MSITSPFECVRQTNTITEVDPLLSEAAEKRLKASLIQTLQEAVEALEEALKKDDWGRIYAVGHSLKGNSGAHYFGLDRVRSVGEMLEKVSGVKETSTMKESQARSLGQARSSGDARSSEEAQALTEEALGALKEILRSFISPTDGSKV